MPITDTQREQLNNISPATRNAKLGDILLDLIKNIEKLEENYKSVLKKLKEAEE